MIGTLVIHHRLDDPQFLTVDLCFSQGDLIRMNNFELLLIFRENQSYRINLLHT